jgi:[ribosomal protein S5]-alanine N-acetyltransferase
MPNEHLHVETPRLFLRPLDLQDLAAMEALLAEAYDAWGLPWDPGTPRGWIDRNVQRYEQDGFGRCAVVLRATGDLVGDCGLMRTEVEGAPEVELGWIVLRSHQRRGIATEAAAAWRDLALGDLGLTRIVSMVSEGNLASRRVAEKLGMSVEREAEWGGAPMLMYALAR